MSILFINASPNKNGNTAELARELLDGKEYETLNLIDYKIYAYGQEYADDQFDDIVEAIKKVDTVVMGSPLYWHNICGLMRNFLDRCYGPIGQGEFKGKKLYFIMQGAAPEKWQLEACDFTMSRFAGLYGFEYKGMITDSKEAKNIRME
ncbi:flavodoxin family protein [Butyrivibrio sp. WCE2006]|uniref:flavodoxin family protein n=1 Tax=Butyrivibrio sp. WCE2006 TaxID=1410611 RepID=UPI0005D29C11|nr:NAD(P)H-dependent oxidoreductase [Butyrivibrio sp. WCE2006]